MRSHIGWGGEQNIFYKGVEHLPSRHVLKAFKEKPKRKSPKRTTSTSSGLGLLQMVSKLDTGQCASEDAEPQGGWIRGGVSVRTLKPKGGRLGGSTLIGEGNECQQRC